MGLEDLQLAFFDTNVPRKEKRKTEKYMSNYRMLNAIIEAKKLDLSPSMTQNPSPSETQRSNQFNSETENLALLRQEIEQYERVLNKLDRVYNTLLPDHREIWEERYVLGRRDTDVYLDMGISGSAYYRLKRQLISRVADALGLHKIKK
jgi:ArpU family phage transcriptional regulator